MTIILAGCVVGGALARTAPRLAAYVHALGRQVVLSPPPVVVVDGTNMTSYILINVTAGGVAPLVANRSTCDNTPCTYTW